MTPCELTALVTVIANTLAAQFSDNEILLLSAVLQQLGDTLGTIVAQKAILNSRSDNNNNVIVS